MSIDSTNEYQAYFARVVDNWLKLKYWTPLEAIWLSFGLNPHDVANSHENIPLEDIVGDHDVRILVLQIEGLLESRELKGKDGRVEPHSFIGWASKSLEYPLPAALLAKATAPLPAQVEELPINKREQNNLYRIISALTIAQYGLDPAKADWQKTAREAAQNLQKRGLDIKDEETILKHLKKAILGYPPRYQKPN